MNHKELNVWQESLNLVSDIYKIVKDFPSDEKFGLILQIKRSCISIPSNIAEGCGQKGEKELIRFLYISLGALAELETQIIIAQRLNFVKEEDF